VSPPAKPAADVLSHEARLARAMPVDARRIVIMGCGPEWLGTHGVASRPDREVIGIERDPGAAAGATRQCDRVITLDIERADPPLEAGSVDVLVYGGVLEQLADPLTVLRRQRPLLKPGGSVLVSVANLQHYAVIAALLGGDFQHGPEPLPGAAGRRSFTWSTIFKLLLDAGFAPEILDETSVPAPPALLSAAEPLLRHLGLHPARTRRYLDADRYILRGTPVPTASDGPAEKLTVAACVNDERSLRTNLLASPCLRPGTTHEVLLARGCRHIADGLNAALTRARHPWIVCVHQDVYLPEGWDRMLTHRLREAETRFGPIGVAGMIGAASVGVVQPHAVSPLVGWVVDRDRILRGPEPLPARAETLDELVLVLPRATPLRLDPALGFHFYGADLCLQARELGLAAVAVENLCFHNQRGVDLPPDFFSSGRAFARKWSGQLPVKTICAVIDQRWLADSP
jgi:SAM-dependent methyltransferase